MNYTLYGAPGSGSGIVEAVLEEIGVDYQVRDLDARNDEHRGDAYAAINPQRKMPALVADDGELITETVAIVIALDERHPDARILPPVGSKDRAQAVRWMVFMAAELYPMVEIIDYPERFSPSAELNETMRQRGEALWRERWQVLDTHIAGTPYCLPSGFCATDIYLTKLSVWLDPPFRQTLPRVDAVTRAVYARPTLKKVWARHIPKGL